MPFKSEAQRAYMYANHPEIADRWEKHTPKGAKLPEHVKKTAYYAGCCAALELLKLGAQDATHMPPDYAAGPDVPSAPSAEEAALLQQLAAQQLALGGEGAPGAEGAGAEGQVPGADAFVDFVQQDATDENMGASPTAPQPGNGDEKPTHWSGNASLEGGDAGTRNYQMGLPRFGGV